MKYPRIDGENLTAREKAFFATWYKEFKKSMMFDKQQNALLLTKADISLFAYNCATILTASESRQHRKNKAK